MVGCCKLSLHANGFCDEHAVYFRFIFSGIEALEFSCIYPRVWSTTADEFLVVANMRTKLIQKQIKSIDDDNIGSKKSLASKSCFL